MILKLMGCENMPDDDPLKTCQIIDDIQEAKFEYLTTGEAALSVQYRKPNRGLTRETFVLKANAYLMNDNGKTVQAFGSYSSDPRGIEASRTISDMVGALAPEPSVTAS